MNAHGRLAPQTYRNRFQPRLDILDEVVAGLLWLKLDLPDDVSRPEVEDIARALVARIKSDANVAGIENALTQLQRGMLCRPADPSVIRELAQRSLIAVKGP